MQNHYFKHKPRLLIILLSIAGMSLAVRLLMEYRFHQSALLYVGVPFVLSLALVLLRSPTDPPSWKKQYVNRLIDAFIIMLGSSVVLFEGFLCVAMFMPIYLFVIVLMFIADFFNHRANKQGRNTLNLSIFSVLILFSAFEGVAPKLSFDRQEQISVTRVVAASVADIQQNLQRPMSLQKSRPWFLHLFPMPYLIQAGSLSPGDVHEINFRYYRWFVTNLHEGQLVLEIVSVEQERITTRFIKNTSYLTNYLHLNGTEILLQPMDESHTQVTLKIDFERTLDPYWYFAPVQRYAVSKTAEFLIAEVIAREQG